MRSHLDLAVTVLALPVLCLFAGTAEGSWLAAADSLHALARSNYEAGDYDAAARYYSEVVLHVQGLDHADRSPYSQRMLARSRFLVGRSYEYLGQWGRAIDAYAVSVSELSEISDAVRLRLARCHQELEEFDRAVDVLRSVIDGERTTLHLDALEALADCHRAAGDLDMALQWYRVLLSDADGYDDRARAHYKIGLTYAERGDREAAKLSFAAVVNEFPRSRHAHDALKEGRKLSRAFTDRYHQGLVLYNKREYRKAADFFNYYLRHDENGDFEAEATYFLGRCHQRRGHSSTAARKYRDAIEMGVDSEYYDLAWQRLAYCLWLGDGSGESLATYDRYIELHPDREGAPDILWEKARFLEERKLWEEAAGAFRAVADRYPDSDRSPDALFRAGLCLFKLGRYEEADAWFAGIYVDGEGEDAVRALFWAGKSREALGQNGRAAVRYREAGEIDRDSFYGRRALDRLAALGVPVDEPRAARSRRWTGNPHGRVVGGTGEFQDFAVWLGAWHDQVYVPAARIALLDELSADSHYVRGDTFLAVGMRGLAEEEFALLEEDRGGDPRLLDVLANLYERAGLHKRALRLAERVLAMSPAEGVTDAPAYLRKKICPTHFEEIVVPACAENGIDQGLFFSLIRQESLFEPEAVSWVGARGLSQIMPATGRWIARRLGVRRFRTGQLLDPETSIRFGTYYLSLQIEDSDQDILRALAAYNGGPENAARWWDYGGGRDSDVFVEDIGFAETADYVRRVYLYRQFYRDAYGWPDDQ